MTEATDTLRPPTAAGSTVRRDAGIQDLIRRGIVSERFIRIQQRARIVADCLGIGVHDDISSWKEVAKRERQSAR